MVAIHKNSYVEKCNSFVKHISNDMANSMKSNTVKWLYFARVLISLCLQSPHDHTNKYLANIINMMKCVNRPLFKIL
jgi:hypothetical protein